MKQVYINALMLIDRRIKACGRARSKSIDSFELNYWKQEIILAKAQYATVMKRSKIQHNVVHVDFIARKKVS